MSFTRVQGSGKVQTGLEGVGAGTFSVTNSLADFTPGNLVTVELVHFAIPNTDLVTGVTINGVSAIQRTVVAEPSSTVNQAQLWDAIVPSGSAHTVSVTVSGAASPDGHYMTVAITEWSFAGTLSRRAMTPTSANNSAPSISTDSGAVAGELAISVFVIGDSGVRTLTAPSGWTTEFSEGDSNSHEGGGSASKILSAGGVQAATWGTGGVSLPWANVMVIYKETVAAQVANSQFMAAASG